MIVQVHAGNPGPMTGSGNWTYLLTGAAPVIIDAGVGSAAHIDALAGHLPGGPSEVIVTHAHQDHASGVGALAARWPHARFWKYPWYGKDSRYRVQWHHLADGQVLRAGDEDVRVVHTPGHAPDHVCLWHATSGTLFGGDLLVLGGTVVIPALAEGSLTDYLSSLARVDALEPKRILPAHGPAIEDPHALIQTYVEHRRARERQVLSALEREPSTVGAIARAIYSGLAPSIQAMAEETVLAHLLKLESEQRVERAGETWRLRR